MLYATGGHRQLHGHDCECSPVLHVSDVEPPDHERGVERSQGDGWPGEIVAKGANRPVRRASLRSRSTRASDGQASSLPPNRTRISSPGLSRHRATTTATDSEVRALDIETRTVRTPARFDTRLGFSELINGTLRLWVHPSGRSLLTSTSTDRSNIWLMKGIALPKGWSAPWPR